MGFIEQNLTNNEKIVHKGHLHWFAYAGGLALIAALWAVAMVVIALNVPEDGCLWWLPCWRCSWGISTCGW